MASQPPDAATLQNWEDAFQYPLPTVRKLESQLRTTLTSNRDKLRSLVGTSYRDLLGTAERIIEMDSQLQSAEYLLSDIGKKCNSRSIERIGENHERMKVLRNSGEEERYRRLAQTRVLQGCVNVAGRIVKRRGGDALLAAKVLVLGRLACKSLEPSDVVDGLKKRLGGMRKRLMGYIGRILVRTDVERMEMVRTLCAYSLISSSSPRDVLRYFLQVRFEQLELKVESAAEAGISEMLELYGQTLVDAREVFPRRFADASSQLSKVALVRDESVRSTIELNLDIYEQWISDDVRNFYPWVRHDQLTSGDVGEALASWTKQAQEILLEALQDALQAHFDADVVLDMRHKVLSTYLTLSGKLRNGDHGKMINKLRLLFLTRLEELVGDAASLPERIFDIPQEKAGDESPILYALADNGLDLEGGALSFRQTVVRRQYGRDASILRVTTALDDWTQRLNKSAEMISSLRTTKWKNDLDLDLDDLPDGASLHDVLGKQDPQHLETKLRESATSAFEASYRHVEKSLDSSEDPRTLLRVVREIDQRRRNLGEHLEVHTSTKASVEFVAALHRRVATHTSDDPIKQFSKRLQTRSHVPVTLWDGSPPLPLQPSANAYRFLRGLHHAMSEAGNDIWSPDAVSILKIRLVQELGGQLKVDEICEGLESSMSNGHANDDDQAEPTDNAAAKSEDSSKEQVKNKLTQMLFDILYLQRVLLTSSSPSTKLEATAQEIRQRLELDASANERLRKSANEYWKRTYLLFGLLAVGHERSSS
ncbi:uncharacterized protein CLAFUR5_03317 [Fulvia fulva]|uniref:Conserved oligomeric Golgi complex subunit 1 n=1 Tax=Passalora fulva TaxID=5499 RepID=A0A9Q8LAP5_PASFU|nr:uncharacterized protein CLAFUR5_03317 [Fulvia fulva]UJO13902.1 hypothetical protein CLAFUR5_03317 [Fulvia fulva]